MFLFFYLMFYSDLIPLSFRPLSFLLLLNKLEKNLCQKLNLLNEYILKAFIYKID